MVGEPQREGGARLVRDVSRRLYWLGWLANGSGALVVFFSIAFLIPIFIDPGDRDRLGLLNAPLVFAYVIGAGFVITRRTDRDRKRALRWIDEGRPPEPSEHEATLKLAIAATRLAAIAWAVAGVLFFAINLTHSLSFAALVAVAVWLGGETTCALLYLITERALRPVTALALAASVPAKPVAPGSGAGC